MGLIAGTFAVLFAAMGPRSEPRITVLVYNPGAVPETTLGARSESQAIFCRKPECRWSGVLPAPKTPSRLPRKSPYICYMPARRNSITMPKASP